MRAEDFWSNVNIGAPDECWDWRRGQHAGGYGRFRLENKTVSAHRHAYAVTKGAIPEGMDVCHTCDRPVCCNPGHLFIGTTADNMRDCAIKGRRAKLSHEAIRDIRASDRGGIPHKTIAEKHGITVGAISNIATGKRRQHIPDESEL